MQTTEATRAVKTHTPVVGPRPGLSRPWLNPLHMLRKVLNKIVYPAMLRMCGGVRVGGSIIIKGWPHLEIDRGATVRIGEGVTLNSSNRGYHVNMHSPVKLYAEGQGTEIIIGAETRIHGTCLHACERIEIGNKCLIAANTQIFDTSGHDISFENVENRLNTQGVTKPVIIEDCVWIGANCLILPGVRIGHGSVIAAGSVVTKTIPPMSLAGGNPARVIQTFASTDA
jgi:acetyltransferase-like isoleucine patch superfamily enzyme